MLVRSLVILILRYNILNFDNHLISDSEVLACVAAPKPPSLSTDSISLIRGSSSSTVPTHDGSTSSETLRDLRMAIFVC